jgi:hypothetical protein
VQLYGFVGLCSSDPCLQPQRIDCEPFLGTYSKDEHLQPFSLQGNGIGLVEGISLKSV